MSLKAEQVKETWILQGEMNLGTYLGIWPVFKTIQIDIKSNHISYSNTIIFPSTTLEHKNWSWFISCFCFNQWIFSLLNIPILFRKKYNNGILLSVGFYPLKAINAFMLSACMLYCSRENQGYSHGCHSYHSINVKGRGYLNFVYIHLSEHDSEKASLF